MDETTDHDSLPATTQSNSSQRLDEDAMEELREARAAITAMKDRLQRVLGSMTEGYYVLDPEWRFVEMNAVAEQHFQRPAAGLLGKNIWEETGVTSDSPLRRAFHEAVAGGRPVHFEAESHLSPGYWSDLHLHPHDGALDVYFHDITDRKRVELALRESEAVFRSFFDSPGVMRGIVELADGKIVHVSCNAAAAEMARRGSGVNRRQVRKRRGHSRRGGAALGQPLRGEPALGQTRHHGIRPPGHRRP
jgi:PAS domain-containing protein